MGGDGTVATMSPIILHEIHSLNGVTLHAFHCCLHIFLSLQKGAG